MQIQRHFERAPMAGREERYARGVAELMGCAMADLEVNTKNLDCTLCIYDCTIVA